MRSNNTQLITYKTGRRENLLLKNNPRKFTSNLSANYSILLQLYYLNKKQTLTKKELKYVKLTSDAAVKTKSRSFFSIPTKVAAFFTINFSMIKKAKQRIALVTE